MSSKVQPPYPLFHDIDGRPLDAGYIYIGEAGKNPEVYPIPVFWDENLTVPAEQPIRTRNGFFAKNGRAGKIFTSNADCSITIKNKKNIIVSTDLFSDLFFDQKNIVSTVNSIDDLNSIEVWDGRTVKAKCYNKPKNFALAQPYKGGGILTYNASKANLNDGYMCFNGWERADVTIVTPELAGAYADGITLDDDAFSRLLSIENMTVYANNEYLISSNITPALNTKLTGSGKITQKIAIDETYNWTIFNPSNHPMFHVVNDGFELSSLKINPTYEVILTKDTRSNIKIKGNIIDGGSGTEASGFVLNELQDSIFSGNHMKFIGKKGTYVSSSDYYGKGIGVYCHRGLHITDNIISHSGHCGLYGIFYKEMVVTGNTLCFNGLSGIQFGNNVDFNGYVVANNIVIGNYADGIDINSNSDTVSALSNGSIVGNFIAANGWFNNDLTKPTVDGGGITQRGLANYTVTGNVIYNNRSTGMYVTATTNSAINSNIILNNINESRGIEIINSALKCIVSNNIVSTKGSAFATSNNGVFDFKLQSNYFESKDSSAAVFYNANYMNSTSMLNDYRGVGGMNCYFSSIFDAFDFGANALGTAIYVSMSYRKIIGARVFGNADNLVFFDGGYFNAVRDSFFQNSSPKSTSAALGSLNGTELTLDKNVFLGAVGSNLSGGSVHSIDCLYQGSVNSIVNSSQLYLTGRNIMNGNAIYNTKPYRAQYVQDV